jgi:hypothetical protein
LLILRAIVRIGPGLLYSFLHFWGISKNGIRGVRAPAFHFFKMPLFLGKKEINNNNAGFYGFSTEFLAGLYVR